MAPGEVRLSAAPLQRPGPALLAIVAAGATVACGAGMTLSAVIGLTGDGRAIAALLVPGILAFGAGLAGLLLLPRPARTGAISPTAGLGAIVLAWTLAATLGAVPLVASGELAEPLDAYFEAMSGFTTTGATLIDDVDGSPDSVLFWRSAMQWLGGIGIVVLIVAIAPTLAPGLQRYFYSEASGLGDRLTPRISDTAKILGRIYLGLTVAAVLAFWAAGMGGFDALNHGLTTIATGGFSTHTSSLEHFDSLAVEIVAIVFMAVAAVNFAFYWKAIKGAPLMPQLAEIRLYASILLVATGAITASLLHGGDYETFGGALRAGAFTVASISSTTGFTTADFDLWGGFAETSLVLLMVVGGCAGSTAGGMKVLRVALLSRSAALELRRQTQPRAVTVLRIGGRVFNENVRNAVLGFFVIYALLFALGVIVFTAGGLGEVGAIGGVAATLNNVGPGLGAVGGIENYGELADGGRAMAIFLMLAGRLEIFTVVALLAALVRMALRR